jgi:threonine/homoserine/homoserine lactone efflux protein
MPLANWLAFAAASALLLVIPGPTVLLVISYALGQGRRAAAATVTGVTLGDITCVSCSMLGLGALLAASAVLFAAVRLAGAAYLVFLGVRLWRTPVAEAAAATPLVRRRRMFIHAFAVTALNPKSIVFFVAFLPQFLDPHEPLLPQMMLLGATFIGLAMLVVSSYAVMAASARRVICRPAYQRIVNRSGGGLLVGAGVLAAAWRR